MKIIILLIVVLFGSLSSLAAEQQDIVIKTRFDRSSTAIMVEKFREYLLRNDMGDPYHQQIGDLSVEFSQVMDRLPPETQRWVRDLQEVMPLRIFDSEYRLVVEDLGYSIQSFDAELRPTRSAPERVEYVTFNNVYGLSLHARYIAFEVKLPDIEGEDPIKFDVVLKEPTFTLNPEVTAELEMGWYMSLMPGELFLSLHTIDLLKTFEKLKERPDLIKLDMEDLLLPEVSIRIGNREIPFDHTKIKRFLKNKEEELKQGIFELMSTRLGSRLSNVIADSPMEVHVARNLSIEGKINGSFELKDIRIEERSILKGDINGKFTNIEGREIMARMRRELDPSNFERSMNLIDDTLLDKSGNLVVSISEHFLNQAIIAAIDSGAIDLNNQGFTLGPEKLFVLAEKKGKTLSLYIDIIHKLSNAQRILVGRPELHFPVKLGIGLNMVNTDGHPRLQIKVLKIETNDEMILNGIRAYGLKSNVSSVRFRKMVLDMINQEIRSFEDKMLVDLELKEFKDTYLDRLDFSSDGFGRATAVLDLQ